MFKHFLHRHPWRAERDAGPGALPAGGSRPGLLRHFSLLPAVLLLLAACQGGPDEEASTPPGEPRKGYILFNGEPLEISYSEHHGRAIWQGDLIVGAAGTVARTAEEARSRAGAGERSAFSHATPTLQWPGARVPYVIYGTVSNPQAVKAGMNQLERQTGIDFYPRTTETTYLEVDETPDGCYGFYDFGARVMLMPPAGCSTSGKAIAMHELGHALGLWHEHVRCDRDNHITLYWANINADGVGAQYEKLCTGSYNGTAYDVSSIMHYGSNDWVYDPHFLDKGGNVVPGFFTRGNISAADVTGLKNIYKLHGDIVVDSDNTRNNTAKAKFEAAASWATGTATSDYLTGYRYASTQAISDPATFWFYLPAAGTRTVYAWWTSGGNRSTSAPYIAFDASGTRLGSVSRNQQVSGGEWNRLGSWSFSAGWNKVQLSRWTTEGSVVIADAILVR